MGNDITKMKIFADVDPERLEKRVNEFMEDKFVYDIKFTSILANNGYGGTVLSDRIVILYEDRYEEESVVADDNIMTMGEAIEKIVKGEI